MDLSGICGQFWMILKSLHSPPEPLFHADSVAYALSIIQAMIAQCKIVGGDQDAVVLKLCIIIFISIKIVLRTWDSSLNGV